MTARKLVLALGLGVAALLAVFGDRTPVGSVAEPVVRDSTKGAAKVPNQASAPTAALGPFNEAMFEHGSATSPKPESGPVVWALRPREELSGNASTKREGADLFASKSWEPPPPPPVPPPPPPPPSAPQFPYTYIGKKIEDAVWEVYLARGGQTFVVRQQTIIEGNYRVESIKPPLVVLTYLPLNLMQTLIIEGAD